MTTALITSAALTEYHFGSEGSDRAHIGLIAEIETET